MRIIQPVGYGDHSLIETVVAGFVASNEQYRASTRVKREQGTERPPLVLRPKFLHVRMPGTLNCIDVWTAQVGTQLPQQFDAGREGLLFLLVQAIPPIAKFVRKLDIPHTLIIACML